nr:MAG TPA: hypothetical protein [Caudoviricetes sp.]
MSDGIHIPAGTAGEKPGRTLRNLGEPWEPLRTWRGVREGRTGRRGVGRAVPIRCPASTYHGVWSPPRPDNREGTRSER